MTKKVLHLLMMSLLMVITYGNSIGHTWTCTCHCRLDDQGDNPYTFPDQSYSSVGCSDRCYYQRGLPQSCCDFGYDSYRCPGWLDASERCSPIKRDSKAKSRTMQFDPSKKNLSTLHNIDPPKEESKKPKTDSKKK